VKYLPQELILIKRSGKALTHDQIQEFLEAYLSGLVEEYQMSAFLMAVFFRGFSAEELTQWTQTMVSTGERLGICTTTCIDKHSTGGVGDKTSFLIAPIAAVCGCQVPMLSGRALGHTGGTLDKLEAIPGVRIPDSVEGIEKLVEKHGFCFGGTTRSMAPLDKKLYALRDVTGTIESTDLIASSIMSKKLAENLKGLVMDIKVGDGAFMKTPEQARNLLEKIQMIAKSNRIRLKGVISDMSQPLGHYLGLRPEIYEVLMAFQNKAESRLMELSLELASKMLLVAGLEQDESAAKVKVESALMSGRAYQKFCEVIEAQGGDISTFENPEFYLSSKHHFEILSPRSGYISRISTEKLGYVFSALGAGRKNISDTIIPQVGAKVSKKIGDSVVAGEPLLTGFLAEIPSQILQSQLAGCFEIGDVKVSAPELVIERF
jgi:pyrimidine-nucleoside phosphorylase